jgi:hypothetical protein
MTTAAMCRLYANRAAHSLPPYQGGITGGSDMEATRPIRTPSGSDTIYPNPKRELGVNPSEERQRHDQSFTLFDPVRAYAHSRG